MKSGKWNALNFDQIQIALANEGSGHKFKHIIIQPKTYSVVIDKLYEAAHFVTNPYRRVYTAATNHHHTIM